MKVLYCLTCTTIISPFPSPDRVRFCDCGQACVRWIDPYTGKLEVKAVDLEKVRVIGLANTMLEAATLGPPDGSGYRPDKNFWWRGQHRVTTENTTGYLFSQELRNCWAIIIKEGESGDITWIAG